MTQGEFITNWATFLRANPEKQGTGCLRAGDKMCCLGAGLEVLGVQAVAVPAEVASRAQYSYEGCLSLPSEDQAKRMGLRTCTGEFRPGNLPLSLRKKAGLSGTQCLTSLNDNGVPWSVIADIIEAQPEGLFIREDEVETATP